MSGTFSFALEAALLNHVFSGTAYPPPASVNIALYLAPPGAAGGGTELANADYSRVPVAFGAPSGTPPLVNNPAVVQWPAAQSNWGTIVAAGLFDAPSAGNFLGSAMLVDPTDGVTPQPKIIAAGDVFRIAAGNLIVGFAPTPLASSAIMVRGVMAPIRAELVMARRNGR